jgi:hypothetical protein
MRAKQQAPDEFAFVPSNLPPMIPMTWRALSTMIHMAQDRAPPKDRPPGLIKRDRATADRFLAQIALYWRSHDEHITQPQFLRLAQLAGMNGDKLLSNKLRSMRRK